MNWELVKEKFWFKLAWLMPKKLVYFCAIRLVAHATQGRYSRQVVPELSAMDAIQRWDTDVPFIEKQEDIFNTVEQISIIQLNKKNLEI